MKLVTASIATVGLYASDLAAVQGCCDNLLDPCCGYETYWVSRKTFAYRTGWTAVAPPAGAVLDVFQVSRSPSGPLSSRHVLLKGTCRQFLYKYVSFVVSLGRKRRNQVLGLRLGRGYTPYFFSLKSHETRSLPKPKIK